MEGETKEVIFEMSLAYKTKKANLGLASVLFDCWYLIINLPPLPRRTTCPL